MPTKYVVRNFTKNMHYHVFNRGVEKRKIFLDENDHNIFLYYLSIYLLPLEEALTLYPKLPIRLHQKNLNKEVELLSYVLMPNHFHLLLRQNTINGISKLLKQVTNAYTFYFNTKYERVGGLFQGVFKAVQIDTDEQLLHTSRYIHLNPVVADIVKNPKYYKWSSYPEYISEDKPAQSFVQKGSILSYFSSPAKFEDFVRDQVDYARELEKIKHLTLD